MVAENVAYRIVLRLCRNADRRPMQSAVMLGRPPRWFVPDANRVVFTASQWPFVNDAVRDACGGSTEFAHPVERGASRAARKHRRLVEALGLDYVPESRVLQRHFEMAEKLAADMDELLGYTSATIGPDSSEKVTLRRILPSETDAVHVGSMLLAHPISCMQSVFDMAVILITKVDVIQDQVAGFVLNKPTGQTLRHILSASANLSDVDRDWLDGLGPLLDIPFCIGGPVMHEPLSESIVWLHQSDGRVPGSQEVAPSIWIGGNGADIGAIAIEDPTKVRLVFGYSAWASIQLANELERGVWVHARMEKPVDVVSTPCKKPGDAERMWRTLLRNLGMHALASFPRKKHSDAVLEEAVSNHHISCMEDVRRVLKESEA